MKIREELLFLSEADVLSLLTPSEAITAAEDTFRRIGSGDITVGVNSVTPVSTEKNNAFHSMPAILHHKRFAGMKWIGTYNDPLQGYPFTHGNLLILSDTNTGSPIAVIGATSITALRTAGGHAVVQAKYLCTPEPRVLSVIGCGVQAKAGIRGFLDQFQSVRQLRLFSRSREPMEQVQKELNDRVEVVLCSSPEEALRGSQLILVASGARSPLVTAEMLCPGMTIVGLTAFRDMDPRIVRKSDKWYVGYRESDSHILYSADLNPGGLLTEADVFADMTELLNGRVEGRVREDEIIVATHMGMGAHDISCAAIVYERAVEKGIGQKLLLDF